MTRTAGQNGHADPEETIIVPRDLMQEILDYLARCPAGGVYQILRRLEIEAHLEQTSDGTPTKTPARA